MKVFHNCWICSIIMNSNKIYIAVSFRYLIFFFLPIITYITKYFIKFSRRHMIISHFVFPLIALVIFVHNWDEVWGQWHHCHMHKQHVSVYVLRSEKLDEIFVTIPEPTSCHQLCTINMYQSMRQDQESLMKFSSPYQNRLHVINYVQ